jgi:hypothetical protein
MDHNRISHISLNLVLLFLSVLTTALIFYSVNRIITVRSGVGSIYAKNNNDMMTNVSYVKKIKSAYPEFPLCYNGVKQRVLDDVKGGLKMTAVFKDDMEQVVYCYYDGFKEAGWMMEDEDIGGNNAQMFTGVKNGSVVEFSAIKSGISDISVELTLTK